jgi:hypothetical protein
MVKVTIQKHLAGNSHIHYFKKFGEIVTTVLALNVWKNGHGVPVQLYYP